MSDWDGIERRETVTLAEALKPPADRVDAPTVMVLVGFAAILLLQTASLWGHGLLADRQTKNEERDELFRQQITCFVVNATQGKQGTDVLTTCGFLNTGGKK